MILRLTGENPSKYYISLENEDECPILGRQWDNISEAIQVIKPEQEVDSSCTMFCVYKGRYIDSFIVGNNPIEIKNNISQYPWIDISFSFTKENGYVKNSEIKRFYFAEARKPQDFVPEDPTIISDLQRLISSAFCKATYSNSVLSFYTLSDVLIFSAEIDSTPDVDAIVSINTEIVGDQASLIIVQKNLKTLIEETTSVEIPLVTSTSCGLMSSVAYNDLQTAKENISVLQNKVNSLEGQTVRLLYTDKNDPTSEEIEQFVIDSGYTNQSLWSKIAVVVSGTKHIWHWYRETDQSVNQQISISSGTLNNLKTLLDNAISQIVFNNAYKYSIFINPQDGFQVNGNCLLNATIDYLDDEDTSWSETLPVFQIEYNNIEGQYELVVNGFITDKNVQSISTTIAQDATLNLIGNISIVEFDESWQDDGIDTVSNFTNTNPGMIKGSPLVGFVSAQGDGTGKVNGFDTKLDKVTSTGFTDRVYAIDRYGNQELISVYDTVTVNSLVRRNTLGQLIVRLNPTANNEATSKQYVDTQLVGKQNKLTAKNNIVIENDEISAKSASCKILGNNGLSFGSNSIANTKGFAIVDVNASMIQISTIEPSTGQSYLVTNDVVGKYFSIISNTHFAFCGTVTGLDAAGDDVVIYYTPTTLHGTTLSSATPWWTLQTISDYAPLTHGVLWFPDLPELGYELKYGANYEYSFFEDSTAIGDTCYASADDAFVSGESNVAGGNHAVIFGKLNKGGYGNIINGIQNFSNGLHSALFGRYFVNHGDYNLLSGHTVTVEGNYHSIHGYLVTEDYATRGNCNLGGGYNISFGGRCHLFGGRDHTIRGENHLIGGRENNVQGVNHTVGGWGNTVSGVGHAVFNGKGYTGYNGNTVTNGYNCFVGGTGNILPTGMWSFVFGFNNDLTGLTTQHVYLMGRELHPAKQYQFLTGRANVDDSGAALVIGNGASASSRSNCFTVGASGTRSNVNTDAVTVQYFNSHIDNTLSTTSENPVQNKVIKLALDGKLDKVAATSTNARKLYGTSNSGASYMYSILRTVAEMETSSGGVLGRADNNHFVVPTPTNANDIANKGYVDNAIAGAGGSTWVGGLSTTSVVIDCTSGYHSYTFFYHGGNLGIDYYATSTIILGPQQGVIEIRGTTDGYGAYVTASIYEDIDDYNPDTGTYTFRATVTTSTNDFIYGYLVC